MPPEQPPSSPGLKRRLSSSFALAVTVGGVIGLGIMRTPGEMAGVVTEPSLYLWIWLLAGLFVLISTSVVAELVGMTPRSGGCYSLVRNAFGPYAGFLIGWVDWLSFVADIALKAVVICEFLAILAPQVSAWQLPLAIAITSVFALLQLRGVVLGARIQQAAAAGMAIIVIGFAIALWLAGPADGDGALAPAQTGLSAWSLVLATVIFTYDGWMYAAYFNGEVKSGAGAVARSCIKGIVLVIVLYMLLNGALVWSTPMSSLAGSDLALASAVETVISPAAASVVVIAAIAILLAHQNLAYMGAPRILYAMSVDGLATKRARRIGRRGNPVVAVMISWAVSVGLILVGGFNFLLHLCVFFFVFLYVVLIWGVISLRWKRPEQERPYMAWAHPWSSWFCLLIWTAVTVFQAVSEPDTAIYALALTVISWPVYRWLVNRRAKG